MTSAALHFRTDDALAARFDALVAARNPVAAVQLVLQTAHSIAAADVPVPHVDALDALPRESRGTYVATHDYELALERRALALVKNAATIRATNASVATKAADSDRAAFVAARVAALEAEHHARLRRGWAEQAEAEARSRFDAPDPEPPAAAAARPKTRKVVELHTTKAGIQ